MDKITKTLLVTSLTRSQLCSRAVSLIEAKEDVEVDKMKHT